MKFDEFLATVGDWGKFQKIKYGLICLTYMLPPIMVYTYTFTAATPHFRCQNPSFSGNDAYTNTSNQIFDTRYKPTKEQCKMRQGHLSIAECQRCFRQAEDGSGELEKCDGYVFDKTHYERTLVEEVNLLRFGMVTYEHIRFF